MKKTSLSDIARALGVSKTLVSLVLNNRGNEVGINKETQKKVIKMAQKLNYKPNLIARGLRLGASKTIGLIVPNIGNQFFANIARVVEDEAGKNDYRVISVSSDENPVKEASLIKVLLERQIDGLILASSLKERNEILSLKNEKVPFVLIDRHFPQIKTNYVVVDNYSAAYNVVTHLINQGFKKIALVKITPSYLTPIKLRFDGYREALHDHGIRFDKRQVKEIPFGGIKATMEQALPELLFRPVSAEALFFLNNDLTVAGLGIINKLGLRIPQDVAIVSFDDLELFQLLYPPITAVAQPWQDMAKNAVHILVQEMQSQGKNIEKTQIVLPTKLEVRKSCNKF